MTLLDQVRSSKREKLVFFIYLRKHKWCSPPQC